jgi:hypothetical protein
MFEPPNNDNAFDRQGSVRILPLELAARFVLSAAAVFYVSDTADQRRGIRIANPYLVSAISVASVPWTSSW